MIPSNECIAYQAKPALDSHAAMDKFGTYTIMQDGNYAVLIDSKLYKKFYKAGETIKHPTVVIKESCGMFYKALFQTK